MVGTSVALGEIWIVVQLGDGVRRLGERKGVTPEICVLRWIVSAGVAAVVGAAVVYGGDHASIQAGVPLSPVDGLRCTWDRG